MEKISEAFMWKTSFQPPSAKVLGALREVSSAQKFSVRLMYDREGGSPG
jgi:hypothetical protein